MECSGSSLGPIFCQDTNLQQATEVLPKRLLRCGQACECDAEKKRYEDLFKDGRGL